MIIIILLIILAVIFTNAKYRGGGKLAELYHGTKTPLTRLEPRPSAVINGESAVFATDNYLHAVYFAAGVNDYEIDFGRFKKERYHLIEQYPGAFDKLHKTIYILHVSADGFTKDKRTGLDNEYIKKEAADVIKYDTIDDCYEYLKDKIKMITYAENLVEMDRRKVTLADSRILAHLPNANLQEILREFPHMSIVEIQQWQSFGEIKSAIDNLPQNNPITIVGPAICATAEGYAAIDIPAKYKYWMKLGEIPEKQKNKYEADKKYYNYEEADLQKIIAAMPHS